MPPALRQQKRPSRTGGLSRRDRERLDPRCKAAVQERLAEWAFERGVQARQMRQEAGKQVHPGMGPFPRVSDFEAGMREPCFLAFVRGQQARDRMKALVQQQQQEKEQEQQ